MTYYPGSLVRVSGSFTDKGTGSAIDPTAVTLSLKSPSGAISEYTGAQITKDATGKYHRDVQPDEPGQWWFRWEATGAAQAADEGWFHVHDSAF